MNAFEQAEQLELELGLARGAFSRVGVLQRAHQFAHGARLDALAHARQSHHFIDLEKKETQHKKKTRVSRVSADELCNLHLSSACDTRFKKCQKCPGRRC